MLAQYSELNILELEIDVSFLLHQVFFYKTTVLQKLRQFWNTIWGKQANKGVYITSIGGMRMRLPKFQDDDKEAKKLRSKGLSEGWEDFKEVLHYQGLSYILKVIYSKLISKHHDDPRVGNFYIEKTWELIVRKYYWLTV